MLLTATIEKEFDLRIFISMYEANIGETLYPSAFEHFYDYLLRTFEIFSDDAKIACWKQNKHLIQQEYELFTT